MSATSTGGLCGKARQQRVRRRAARLYAQKLVDEYFEPPLMEPRIERHVPIGGRSEFLQSVAPPSAPDSFARADEWSSEERAVKLALPLGDGDRQAELALSFGADTSNDAGEPPAVLLVKRAKPELGARSTIGHGRGTSSSYTFGGFLLGCAMGSAAAVMMLMVAQAVVR